jgi:hypothetical protein
MGRVSASWPLTVGLVSAIEADTPTSALLASPGIYNGQAPIGALLPYITIGLAQESDDNVFGAPGTLAGQVLDIWTGRRTSAGGSTQELGDREVKEIYGALRYLLHERPLTVAGFRMVRGTLALLATMEDPGGDTMHGICRFDVIQREA